MSQEPASPPTVCDAASQPPFVSTWLRLYVVVLIWEAVLILTIAAVSSWPYGG